MSRPDLANFMALPEDDGSEAERVNLIGLAEEVRRRADTPGTIAHDLRARLDAEKALMSLSAELLAETERVFGEAQRAHGWLITPLPRLNGLSPAELAAASGGEEELRELLTRIEHGIFS